MGDVKFSTEPLRLTSLEGGVTSKLLDSVGVDSPEDSLDAGAKSKTRRGRGQYNEGCSAIAIATDYAGVNYCNELKIQEF